MFHYQMQFSPSFCFQRPFQPCKSRDSSWHRFLLRKNVALKTAESAEKDREIMAYSLICRENQQKMKTPLSIKRRLVSRERRRYIVIAVIVRLQ